MLQARLVLLRFLLRDIVIKKTIGVCRRRKMKPSQAKKKQEAVIIDIRIKKQRKQKTRICETNDNRTNTKEKNQRHEDTQNKRCGSKSGNFVIPLLFVSETLGILLLWKIIRKILQQVLRGQSFRVKNRDPTTIKKDF